MLFDQDRNALRQVFFSAWRKHSAGGTLDGAEKLVVLVARRHPEYHALLARPDSSADRDWLPEAGETNPFLHMSLHIAIEEQLSADRPPGLRACYQALLRKFGDEHTAQHRMLDCLGESLWRAGRDRAPPSDTDYLECLHRLVQ
jgi:hypothetical protein